MRGIVDGQRAARVVHALAQRDGAAVLDGVDTLREMGLSAAGTLEEVAMLLQQMAIEQAVPGALDDNDPDTAGARQLAGQMPADETQLLYSIVVNGRPELPLLADDYAALTMVLLRLLAFAPQGPAPAGQRAAPLAVSPREARTRSPVPPAVAPPPKALPTSLRPVSAAPRPAASPTVIPPMPPKVSPSAIAAHEPAPVMLKARAPVDPPSAASDEPPPWLDDAPPEEGYEPAAPRNAVTRPEAVAPASVATPAPALQRSALGDQWADAVRPLISRGSISALVRELALQAELVTVEQQDGTPVWRLRVERESLRAEPLRDKLQVALQAAGIEPLRLLVESGPVQDTIARRDTEAREAAQREAEALIRNDPAVRELMQQFSSARIVPGSIKPRTPSDIESQRTAPP